MDPFVHSGIGFHRFQSVLFILTCWKGFMPVVFDLRPSEKVTILWDKPRGIRIMPLALCQRYLYLDGQWYSFGPRNNVPRIGRVLMARGRDATDVALTTTFGMSKLKIFNIGTIEYRVPNV